MRDYQKYINALRKCAKEHDNDKTSMGHIIVSDLCRDTANLLEELEQEPQEGAIRDESIMRDATPEERESIDKYIKSISKPTGVNFWEMLKRMPAMAIPPEHDGCEYCRWQSQSETEMPCKQCMHNYTDEWEREKPTDTITMTREEFSEKLMEHYRQGRADEKAYQNGEIMQSFNPD